MQVPLYCLGGTEAKKERIKTLFLWIFPSESGISVLSALTIRFQWNIQEKGGRNILPFQEACQFAPAASSIKLPGGRDVVDIYES